MDASLPIGSRLTIDLTLFYDTGALLAAERGDRTMWALHHRGLDRSGRAVVPAVVLGQVWRGGPQPRLSRLLKGCVIESFDENAGRAVGRLLRDTGTSDVVDAHVVLTALRYRAAVLTSGTDDLQRLAAATKVRLRLHQVW